MRSLARKFLPGLLAGACLALAGLGRPVAPRTDAPCQPAPAVRGEVVLLARGLTDEALIALSSVVARQPKVTLLLDSPATAPHLRRFLQAHRPEKIIPVGSFPEGAAALEKRLGLPVAAPRSGTGQSLDLWEQVRPGHPHLVICPAAPRPRLLQAAWLAGLLESPLWVSDGSKAERARLRKFARASRSPRPVLLLVGGVRAGIGRPEQEVELSSAREVHAFGRKVLTAAGVRPTVAVVANPHDTAKGLGGVSSLAPGLAASKRALLLLTGAKGSDVSELVANEEELDTLILAASPKAVPTEKRPNPIPEDKDQDIEMEPLTPADGQPFRYAVGRVFHDDRAFVPLMLARQWRIADKPGPRKALVASNPGSSLGLLEAFSRNTASELANAGYEVRGLYGKELTARALRRAMVGPDVVLWEGHHNTLVKEWGFPAWDEPLPPALVFLQSCLALQEDKALPLLTRGAVAVVGSSTRVYSGSGGAFALAYFNALLYDGETLGGALRQAKNFMTCYAALKEKRLGEQVQRAGANQRAAWSFTLWGDPTLRPGRPKAPAKALPAVRHEVVNNTVVVHLPEKTHPQVTSGKYQVRMPPNARLAGLVRKAGDDESQPLVPFAFAEVALPGGPAGCEPRLRSRLAAGDRVFNWDARRKVGYLLAVPRAGAKSLRFEVEWAATRVASGR